MFPTIADLIEFDFEIPETLEIAMVDARTCAICHTPPMPRHPSLDVAKDWFLRYDPSLRYLTEIGGASSESLHGRSGDDIEPFDPDTIVPRAVEDSRLEPRLAVPFGALEFIRPRLDDATLDVAWRCVAPICGRCSFTRIAPADVAVRLERIYLESVFDGNRPVATLQRVWPSALAFFAIVDEESRGSNAASQSSAESA